MKCSKAIKIISPYLDGEVSEEEKNFFEAHVKECGTCAVKLEGTRVVQKSFGKAIRYRAPVGFSARVMNRIQSNAQTRPSFVLLSTRFAAAVVILIVIGLGVMTGRFLGSANRPDKAAEAAAFLSLDIFNAAPLDSPGGAYLAMTEGKYEK